MIQQLHISYAGLEKNGALDELIIKESERLERFFERIVSCRVRLYQPQRRHGTQFAAHVEIIVPGETLVIDEQPAPTLERAIREAFHTAGRRVHEYARRLQTPRS